MASPLNRQHRRTAPYVIMNNHSQPPSVAFSARSAPSTSNNETEISTTPENGIRTLVETPLQQPNQENLRSETSFFALVRRAQVCHIEFASAFRFFTMKFFIFAECFQLRRRKLRRSSFLIVQSRFFSVFDDGFNEINDDKSKHNEPIHF